MVVCTLKWDGRKIPGKMIVLYQSEKEFLLSKSAFRNSDHNMAETIHLAPVEKSIQLTKRPQLIFIGKLLLSKRLNGMN